MPNEISVEVIATKILVIRGKKVMLDRDLAQLYGVQTRVLNQAVKRNKSRFPEDFVFSLTREEIKRISQFVISLKFSKTVYAFTEQGVAMLSSVSSFFFEVAGPVRSLPAGRQGINYMLLENTQATRSPSQPANRNFALTKARYSCKIKNYREVVL